jgi:hypothetical protein
MRILKRINYVPLEQRYAVWKCRNCTSLIESSYTDGKYTIDDCYIDPCVDTICPVCIAHNLVPIEYFNNMLRPAD